MNRFRSPSAPRPWSLVAAGLALLPCLPLALLALAALPPGAARALAPCDEKTLACVVGGKVGEKVCVNGRWSACVVPNGGGSAPPAGPDPRCADRSAQGVIKCYVEQPDVRHHETNYPSIVFAPGDVVYVEADGCVQSGGIGATWHRYVNPSGPDSLTQYHGLIRIPTGTPNSALVPIAGEIEQPIAVTGAGVDVNSLFLHLGFEDSDYSDNGYNDHDDGPDDQCAYANDGYPASVAITIFRGVSAAPPASRFDFEVVTTNPLDPNFLMYNPLWSWQLRPGNAGKTPDTSTCHNFSERNFPYVYLSPSFADCTDQADQTSVDIRQMCQIFGQGSGGFGGHVNWFPVTVEGTAAWGDHSGVAQQIFGDDDYTFTFTSDVAGDPLSVNGRPGLHIEFDSDETIDHFTTTEWQALHDAVDNDDSATAAQYFDGHTILTGMFGLDTDHMKSELHPLFALATRRDTHDFENGAADEAWLMFARNVGDEGFCGFKLWSAEFEDYTVRLPWRPGMTSVSVDWARTDFEGTDGTSGPMVRPSPPVFPRQPDKEGVFVTFHLGPVAGAPFVDGVLHLVWSGPQAEIHGVRTGALAGARVGVVGAPGGGAPGARGRIPTGPGAVFHPAVDDEADDIERKLAGALNAVPAAQRPAIIAARAGVAAPRPAPRRLAQGVLVAGGATAAQRSRAASAAGRASGVLAGPSHSVLAGGLVPLRPIRRHAVSVGEASDKLARDAAMMRALCAATHNAPAGLPAAMCAPPTPGRP